MSQWLFSGLADAGLPVICIETRHAKAFLKAQVNKTDRNDARGIAQMMRVNLFRPVHVKTLTSQKRRALLTARKLLQEKAIAIENDIRGLLRNFGLKVGIVGSVGFEDRIRELIDGMPDLAEIIDLSARRQAKLREEFARLHRKVLAIVRDDDVCRRLMTIPGVGPVMSLAFTGTIDVPARFRQLQGRRTGLGTDAGAQPVRREPSDRPGLALRRRHDARAALRGCAGPADPGEEMVLAEGLGDERRQAARPAKGHRRAGAAAGGDHAPHVERRHASSAGQRRGDHRLHNRSPSETEAIEFPSRWRDVLCGTMDEVSALGHLCRSPRRPERAQIARLILLIP